MAGSGLEELMKAAFGGVMKMLTGKNFPQNTRALRIVEQVLHQILCEVNTFDELMQELKARASKSRTAKHLVENLVLPVLLMLMFIRAEQEGEWALHLWALNEMIPYFFAAGHIHYTAGEASALVNIVSGHNAQMRLMYMMLLTCAKHRWKSMKLAGQQLLKKRVGTMKECKKKTRTDTAEQFDSGLIFARALTHELSRH